MGKRGAKIGLFWYIVGLSFLGVFFAGGLFAAYKIADELPQAVASPAWPTVEGTVTKSQVRRRRGNRSLRMRYEYDVNGQTYESGQIAFFGRVLAGTVTERRKRYPLGTKVTVYYNPDNPAVAVLEPGARIVSFLGAGLVVVLFVPLGALGLWGTFKHMRKRE